MSFPPFLPLLPFPPLLPTGIVGTSGGTTEITQPYRRL